MVKALEGLMIVSRISPAIINLPHPLALKLFLVRTEARKRVIIRPRGEITLGPG